MRPQDYAFFAGLASVVGSIVLAARGHAMPAVGASAVLGVALMWASHPISRRYHGPMPAWCRWGLLHPRPLVGPANLTRLLDPHPGERIFELGPGIGVHALPVATALAPGGSLCVRDVQQAMLDHLARRAARAGVRNIEATAGDGESLPYAPATFDGAYLIDVLGEVPDARRVLAELRRTLKAGGRLVIGEYFLDPDFVGFRRLVTMAEEAGFSLDGWRGTRLLYLARFRAMPS